MSGWMKNYLQMSSYPKYMHCKKKIFLCEVFSHNARSRGLNMLWTNVKWTEPCFLRDLETFRCLLSEPLSVQQLFSSFWHILTTNFYVNVSIVPHLGMGLVRTARFVDFRTHLWQSWRLLAGLARRCMPTPGTEVIQRISNSISSSFLIFYFSLDCLFFRLFNISSLT